MFYHYFLSLFTTVIIILVQICLLVEAMIGVIFHSYHFFFIYRTFDVIIRSVIRVIMIFHNTIVTLWYGISTIRWPMIFTTFGTYLILVTMGGTVTKFLTFKALIGHIAVLHLAVAIIYSIHFEPECGMSPSHKLILFSINIWKSGK